MARIDLTGQRFGRLVVIKDAGYSKHRDRVWKCKCDCGKTKFATSSCLKLGKTRSCGCVAKKFSQDNIRKTNKWVRDHDMKEHTRLSALNTKLSSANTSGVKGVSWDKAKKMWRAQLKFQGIIVLSSRFAKKEDAIKARRDAEEKYFKPILEKYHRDKE